MTIVIYFMILMILMPVLAIGLYHGNRILTAYTDNYIESRFSNKKTITKNNNEEETEDEEELDYNELKDTLKDHILQDLAVQDKLLDQELKKKRFEMERTQLRLNVDMHKLEVKIKIILSRVINNFIHRNYIKRDEDNYNEWTINNLDTHSRIADILKIYDLFYAVANKDLIYEDLGLVYDFDNTLMKEFLIAEYVAPIYHQIFDDLLDKHYQKRVYEAQREDQRRAELYENEKKNAWEVIQEKGISDTEKELLDIYEEHKDEMIHFPKSKLDAIFGTPESNNRTSDDYLKHIAGGDRPWDELSREEVENILYRQYY